MRERMLDAGVGRGREREGQQRVLSRTLLNIVAHTGPGVHTRGRAYVAARYACPCVRSRARAHANSVLSKDWKPGEAPLHEILRAL